MASEGERPKSSWQSWVRSAEKRRSVEPPPADGSAADGVDDAVDDPLEAPAEAVHNDFEDAGWEAADAGLEAEALGDGDLAEADLDERLDDLDDLDDLVDLDDLEAEHDDGTDDDDDFGELVPTVPLLPTIAGRVEAITGVLRSISHNVDGLTAATDVYRSATVDRIDEFTETVLEQGRRGEQSLDEYRRTTERAITELRRRLAEQGETAARLLGRVEEIATDVGSLLAAPSATAVAPGRPAAAEIDLAPITDSLAVLIDQQAHLERMLGELPVPEPAAAPAAVADVDLDPVLARVADLHALVEVIVDTMPGSAEGSGLDVAAALGELRAAVEATPKGRSAKAPAIDDAAVSAIADAVVARLDLDALAALVAEHLTSTFEVVGENEADAGRRGRRK